MKRHLTIVIKLGTSSIVDETSHEPLLSNLSTIVETAVALRRDGHRVVICSSGAIGMALRQMDLPRRPKHLPQVQALAAIGQCKLMSLWDSLFTQVRQPVAQILVTRNDMANRTQFNNAQNTLNSLLQMGVIPIINENDTLSVQEIKFGDNDTLSAFAAAMVHAHYLFLMTDVDCLYDKNPRVHSDAKAIEVVENIDALTADTSSSGSALGTGGMSTKISAARLATAAGITTIVTRSNKPGNIAAIVKYTEAAKDREVKVMNSEAAAALERTVPAGSDHTASTLVSTETSLQDVHLEMSRPLHTRFLPNPEPVRDRHVWILHALNAHGVVYVDSGAAAALSNKAALFPAGILDVEGTFGQHECVRVAVLPFKDAPRSEAEEIGRALVNYSAAELKRIRGVPSHQITEILGYADSNEAAFRDSIALYTQKVSRPATPSPRTPPPTQNLGRLSSFVDA